MIRLFKHYISYNVVLLSLIDLMLLVLAGELAWRFRVAQIGAAVGQISDRALEIVAFSAVIWVAMIAVGSYGHQALRSIRFAPARLLVAVSLGVLAIALMNFVFPGSALWRSVLLYAMGLAILFLVGNRVLTGRLLGVENFRRTVLVLGAGERAQRLERLAARPESGFRVAAFISMGNAEPVVVSAVRRETIADLGRYADGLGASEVVLALQERRNSLPLKDLLRVKTKGVDVADFSSFLEREMGRVDLDTLNPSWLIFSDGFSAGRRLSSIAKRAFDIVASLLLLVVGLPLIGLFALLVKLESDGPAFFRQKRVGLYGQEFTLIKLRSMRSDAEAVPGTTRYWEGEHGHRDGERWMPAECDVSIRPGWFYHESQDGQVKSPEELVELYYVSVGRGGSFLLNLPPDRRGLIHERDEESLRGMRAILDATFAEDLALRALERDGLDAQERATAPPMPDSGGPH